MFFWVRDWMDLHTTKPSGSGMGREVGQVSLNNRIDYISLSLTQKLPSDFALFTQKDFIAFHYKTFLLVMTLVPSRNKALWLFLDFSSRDCCMLSMTHKREKKGRSWFVIEKASIFFPLDTYAMPLVKNIINGLEIKT